MPATAPFRLFDAQVLRTRRLGPSLTRVTFGGEQLGEFAGGGRDQSFSLFLPRAGQQAPVVPGDYGDGWFWRWQETDPAVRAVMRSYTVRDQRRDEAEIDVDFVLHGIQGDGASHPAGPASRWAARAVPGDRVVLLGPTVADNKSVCFRPPPRTDWMLIAADETALPAVGGILAWLPAGTRASVWLEVPHAADVQELGCAADTEITWLVRDEGARLLDAVRAAALPEGTPYAWIAGESGCVKALRRHLVGDRTFDRGAVTFSGYWRRGASEEDLRDEALAQSAPDVT